MSRRIVITGAAGLVGQNLIPRLRAEGFEDIVALDKHRANLAILRELHPDITAECVDLADPGEWRSYFSGAEAVVMLQAQIGGNDYEAFVRNNVDSTRNVLAAVETHQVPYLVHVSSSVVESVANDFYTNTKKEQERLVEESSVPHVILRPTLMYGWFDRKHLGWLSRFMRRTPVFPIPGDGRYMRQPLYAGDFCNIIASCIERRFSGATYNISGLEKVDYIDMIREIKRATAAKTPIVSIPYHAFYVLLWAYALLDHDPPFTTQQLAALVAHDEFEVIDWPGIFGVAPTPFAEAIAETFTHPAYSRVVLEF